MSTKENPELQIKVGTYENNPKVFSNIKGEFKGIFPEILEYIAQQENWQIDYLNGTWNQGLERLNSGEIDIMLDVAYSPEREDLYDFNLESLFTNWGVLYQKSEKPQIYTYSELEGLRIAVMKGSIHNNGTKGIRNLLGSYNISCTFIEYNDYTKVLQSVQMNESDIGVVNRIFGEIYGKDFGLESTGLIFNPVELKFAFPKNAEKNKILIPSIDYHIHQLKQDEDSLYYSVLDTYIFSISQQELPKWVEFIIISCIGISVILVTCNFLLKKAIKRKTYELTQTKFQLIEEKYRTDKFESLRLFAKGIAHDFNNFLLVLSGNMDLIKTNEDLPSGLQESIDEISFSVVAAQGLVEQLRNFSKPKELTLEEVDIIKILENSAKLVVSGTECTFSIISTFDEIPIKIDIGNIIQVHTNIMLNAVEAMPEGGRILIFFDKIDLDLENSYNLPQGRYVEIKTRDEGLGISTEDLSRIFTPFFTTKKKGTGLGMVVSRSIIERFGGILFLESEINVGTTVTILLPINTLK